MLEASVTRLTGARPQPLQAPIGCPTGTKLPPRTPMRSLLLRPPAVGMGRDPSQADDGVSHFSYPGRGEGRRKPMARKRVELRLMPGA